MRVVFEADRAWVALDVVKSVKGGKRVYSFWSFLAGESLTHCCSLLAERGVEL